RLDDRDHPVPAPGLGGGALLLLLFLLRRLLAVLGNLFPDLAWRQAFRHHGLLSDGTRPAVPVLAAGIPGPAGRRDPYDPSPPPLPWCPPHPGWVNSLADGGQHARVGDGIAQPLVVPVVLVGVGEREVGDGVVEVLATAQVARDDGCPPGPGVRPGQRPAAEPAVVAEL